MKKWLPLIIIIVLLYVGYSWAKGINNTAIINQENAKASWSNVESAYQRRNDLIGNLVKTVQGAADFEKSTLTEVVNARAKATSTTIDAGSLTGSSLVQFQQAQSGLSSALSKLLVVVEKYPDLKSNQNFMELQNQLEGTENRIKMERDRFNGKVNEYNKHIKIFPNSVLAGVFGFESMNLYSSNSGSENAVEVKFDFKEKE